MRQTLPTSNDECTGGLSFRISACSVCFVRPTLLLLAACCALAISGCRAKPFPSPSFTAGLLNKGSFEQPLNRSLGVVSDTSQAVSSEGSLANKTASATPTPVTPINATPTNKTLVSHTSYQEDVPRPSFESQEPVAEDSESENSEAENSAAAENKTSAVASDDETQSRSGTVPFTDPPQSPSPIASPSSLTLESVLSATVRFYPEIEATIREFGIAQGAALQAQGNFDTKLKVSSENTPIGFYETYRSKFDIEQPTLNGGSLFAGYRFGRGDIEPWYLERNTNELGELKLGANWALLRGREIDARRLSVWQANLKQQRVEPLVLNQLIRTLRDAEVTYWNWVAAGQMFQLNQKLLGIAESRIDGIEERIKAGDVAEISRTDNNRTILSRQVKLLKAKAKLASAVIKLSLFYRDGNGTPATPDVSRVPEIGQLQQWDRRDSNSLVASAIARRPEVHLIRLEMEAVSLDIAKARNDFLPQLNAQLSVSQDFGDPTSASAVASSSTQTLFVNFDEKDEFQVDASLSLSQSLQRRKASGKVRALDGKLHQLRIKQAFLKEKIGAEVQANYQLTAVANEQIQVASRSLELAQQLSDVARERYAEGDVDLFEIILREKQELDSAVEQIESAFSFHVNRANLNAAVGSVGLDQLDRLLR